MFRAPNESMSDIKVIHGLRTFAMVWIIFGHTIGLVNPEMMSKYLGIPFFVHNNLSLYRHAFFLSPLQKWHLA